MNSKIKNYLFNTDLNSIYQKFWVTHDLLNLSPNAILNFKTEEKNSLISIENADLSFSEIQLIFIEHQIKYNSMSAELL
ncbi:hypothetical protein [Flavobacterium daejeonense]|uniref:hypothetical protein n=1 Tax=Flavobacterium daejeonense TaxID=350893 RepID=UPI00047E89FC|nr:hypothetical protein [Flavobacterium daejeonense]